MVKELKITGLRSLKRELNRFDFVGKNVQSRFLDMIGEESLRMLQANTPVDTGNLRESWVLQKSASEVTIANDNQDLIVHLERLVHNINRLLEVKIL